MTGKGGEKSGRVEDRADLEITARAGLSELRFTKVPDIETRFEGNFSWRSFSNSRRRSLPNEVQRDTDYREAGIEWRAVSWIDKSTEGDAEDPDLKHAAYTEHTKHTRNTES